MDSRNISEYVTQLSDAKPRFDFPIRIALPSNAPNRVKLSENDKYLLKNVFSPTALSNSKRTLVHTIGKDSSSRFKSLETEYLRSNQDGETITAISDYISVAQSSRRIGKRDIEGNSYVSLGVIYDNQEEYIKAIEQYEKYLEISKLTWENNQDITGIVTAYNCISVDYILLASPLSECGTIDGVIREDDKIVEYIEKAILYSQKHLEVVPDDGGKFVANTNLGLCYGMKGDYSQSGKYHQDALRIAIKMQTLYGQSISVGNLGLVAFKKNDLSTAQTCFQQHIQLVQALSDQDAQIKAWTILAAVNQAEENYQEALNNYEIATKLATENGLFNELRRIHCLIGLVRGKKDFQSYLKNRLDELKTNNTTINS